MHMFLLFPLHHLKVNVLLCALNTVQHIHTFVDRLGKVIRDRN